MKVIIVGGVAGGASAAARLRRLDEQAEIVLLERGPYISFANCGLPYYISGEIRDRAQLSVQTPESFAARFAVDVRILSEAVDVDRNSKTVTIVDHATGRRYQERYDKLLLSPGPSRCARRCPAWTMRASLPFAPFRTPWPSAPSLKPSIPPKHSS